MSEPMSADIIGGFEYAYPNCLGCGKPLTIENAWMTDGCPCNSVLGVNNRNETRWRLLMQLQQQQSTAMEALREALVSLKELFEFHEGSAKPEFEGAYPTIRVNGTDWSEGLAKIAAALAPAKVKHGKDCPKKEHIREGYLHDADDDRPYDVDGVLYCGRCHYAMDCEPPAKVGG